MNLALRFTWWRERRRQHPADEIQRVGDLSEQRLAKLCRAAGKKNGWQVFESVRIPDEELGGKREIDLVIVGGHTLLVIEQKHWSGRFEINEQEEFIQHRKNGTTHNHSTVNQRISRKAAMLTMMHEQRVPNAEEIDVRVILAFTNENLKWPDTVNMLSSDVVNETGLLSILEREDPGKMNQDLLNTISGFGTWDEVVLNGGFICKGDVLDLGLGSEIYSWQSSRSAELDAACQHQTGLLSLLSRKPSRVELTFTHHHLKASLPYGASLRMHIVGKDVAEQILWSTISHIRLSKP